MELVNKGTKHLKKYLGECNNCGSTFRATKDELSFGHRYNEEYIKAVPCTVCDNGNIMFKEIVTPATTE